MSIKQDPAFERYSRLGTIQSNRIQDHIGAIFGNSASQKVAAYCPAIQPTIDAFGTQRYRMNDLPAGAAVPEGEMVLYHAQVASSAAANLTVGAYKPVAGRVGYILAASLEQSSAVTPADGFFELYDIPGEGITAWTIACTEYRSVLRTEQIPLTRPLIIPGSRPGVTGPGFRGKWITALGATGNLDLNLLVVEVPRGECVWTP